MREVTTPAARGKWQRLILERLAEGGPVLRLRGANRSETTAILRAASTLRAAGLVGIVRLRDGDDVVASYAHLPGATVGGRPVAELNVERVPYGTRSTFVGSVRHIAQAEGVSPTQVMRDLRRSERDSRPAARVPEGDAAPAHAESHLRGG